MVVSLEIQAQIPMLTLPRLTEEARYYLEQVRRARLEEVAAIERLLNYRSKPCQNCGYVKTRK